MDMGQYDHDGTMRQRYLALDERMGSALARVNQSAALREAFLEMMDISWIYHENGLEGIVLSYPEIKSAVDNKIISDVSLLPTYRGIKNQKAGLDAMRHKAHSTTPELTIDFLLSIHAMLAPLGDAQGVYRKDIPVHRTYFHEIVPPAKIVDMLEELLIYVNTLADADLHVIELAANVHHRFMRIFSFTHYSGLIGRLLLNFVLWRHQAIPVVIHASDRQRYYEALRAPERDFRGFIAEAMDNSLTNTMRFLSSYGHSRSARTYH